MPGPFDVIGPWSEVKLDILAEYASPYSRIVGAHGFHHLFETQPNDPGTLALAGVVLLSAAILAGYAPARRASRIDPLAALRHD